MNRMFVIRGVLAFLLVAGLFAMKLVEAENARAKGVEIVLETRPIDPRDLFFGHYATLTYAIEGADLTAVADNALLAETAEEGYRRAKDGDKPLYIILEKKGRFHEAARVTRTRPDSSDGVFLTGTGFMATRRLTSIPREANEDETADARPPAPKLRTQINLPDRYYADPETALALEEKARNAGRQRNERDANPLPGTENEEITFGVILSVSDGGDAVIKGVYLDGQRIVDSLTGPRLTLERNEAPAQ